MNDLKTPLLSVVLMIHDKEKDCKKSINSICSQSLKDIELIYVSELNEQDTQELLTGFPSDSKPIVIYSRQFASIGDAYNYALKKATGKYVSFLESGDFYPNDNVLEHLCMEAILKGVNIIGGSLALYYYRYIHTELPEELGYCSFKEESLLQYKDYQCDLAFQRFVYKLDFLKENHILFPNINCSFDTIFMVKAFISAEFFYAISDITYCKSGMTINVPYTMIGTMKYRECLYALQKELELSAKEELWTLHMCSWNRFWNTACLEAYQTALARHDYVAIRLFLKLLSSFADRCRASISVQQKKKIKKLKNDSVQCLLDYKELIHSLPVVIDSKNIFVSVIMPSLNVEPYIRLCVESVMRQSLSNIEIICVDAGSTDGTLEILEEYARFDSRIRIINSDKKSYGYQVNIGIANARGEYIAIVETDDYISSNMYSELYHIAHDNNLEALKGDFYAFYDETMSDRIYRNIAEDSCYNRVLSGYQLVKEYPNSLSSPMCIWSGIYKAQFLRDCEIRCQETSGASFQDNGFWFLLLLSIKRLQFINSPYYYLRRNNPNSSVMAKNKMNCMKEEYDFIYKQIKNLPDGEKKDLFINICSYYRFRNYIFTFNRIPEAHRLDFLYSVQKEFLCIERRRELDISMMLPVEQQKLTEIMESPDEYYEKVSEINRKALQKPANNGYKTKSKIKRFSRDLGEQLIFIDEYGYKFILKEIKAKLLNRK